MSTLTWEQTRKIAIDVIFEHFGEHLKEIEINILEDTWRGISYREMTQKYHLSLNYLRGDIGHKLWQKLSLALGEKVNKKNFKETIERFSERQQNILITENSSNASGSYPLIKGAISPDSSYYIERPEIERFCLQFLAQSHVFLQIKSPRWMGKTSLLFYLLKARETQSYHTLYLDLKGVETRIISNLESLLDWLCFQISRSLGLNYSLFIAELRNIRSDTVRCTIYFEDYLLLTLERPLILAIDNLDCLFSYPELLQDFWGMLQIWHEKGKRSNRWQKLKMMVAYSTDNLSFLDFNLSLLDWFDLGMVIQLTDFNFSHLDQLLSFYSLNWSTSQKTTLMNLVGGHPYLISLALSAIARGQLSLEQLLQSASDPTSIYAQYLQRYLKLLRHFPSLNQAFSRVVYSENSLALDIIQIEQLLNLGLIQVQDNSVLPKCFLYREYFRRYGSIS